MYIYKTTNLLNGLIYVGQCRRSCEDSINYLGSGKYLKEAIKEFGREHFKKEILCECDNEEDLDNLEIYWISQLDATNPKIGYNILTGGGYGSHSEIIKEALNHPTEIKKAKERNLKKWEDEEYRKKVTESNKKSWSNPDLRKKHSKIQKESYKRNKDYKKHLREGAKRMKTIECPHCGKVGKLNVMVVSHLDKCVKHIDPVIRERNIELRKKRNENTKKIKCPHCGKVGTVGNMRRWHFDNCRKKS